MSKIEVKVLSKEMTVIIYKIIMMNFKNFVYWDDWEKLLSEDIENYQPKDGRWDSPLEQGNSHYTYHFNVPGDDCGSENKPCYKVHISGHPESGVSISFDRDGSYNDQRLGFGKIVFKSILKALGDYVNKLNPAKLKWSAVEKTMPNPVTGTISNPEARAHVYEGWSLRHLFPDKYVGMKGQWIRRDLYDSQYVPNGFPAVPKEINLKSSPSEKAAALENMKQAAKANQEEIDRRERERYEQEQQREREEEEIRRAEARRREEEAEAAQQERIRIDLEDVNINPGHVAKNDIVYIVDPSSSRGYQQQLGRIEDFRTGQWNDDEDVEIYANVAFARDEEDHEFDGRNDRILVSRLRKETSEGAAERERRRQEALAALINNAEKNPNGVAEGDEILTYIAEAPTSEQNGLLGKITKFKNDDGTLKAFVDWDDHAKEILRHQSTLALQVKFLRKATPEERQRIQNQIRSHEIDQQVQRNRGRQQAQQAQAQQTSQGGEEIENLVNHPANPQHLRPGDYVKVSDSSYDYRNRNRRGIVISMEQSHWDDSRVEAYVRFHGSRASPTRFRSVSDLERDASEEATTMQMRQQQQQERRERLSAGSGGHQIGDSVTVITGVHRGKTGRILSFRASGQNVSAVVAGENGNFITSVRALQPPTTNIVAATESYDLSFYSYCLRQFS